MTAVQRTATALLAAPDPVHALAHHLAEQEHRIDLALRRLEHLENHHRCERHDCPAIGRQR